MQAVLPQAGIESEGKVISKKGFIFFKVPTLVGETPCQC